MSPNIRIYRYTKGQYFDCHCELTPSPIPPCLVSPSDCGIMSRVAWNGVSATINPLPSPAPAHIGHLASGRQTHTHTTTGPHAYVPATIPSRITSQSSYISPHDYMPVTPHRQMPACTPSSLFPPVNPICIPHANATNQTTTSTTSPFPPTPRSLSAPPGPSSSTSPPAQRAASGARQSSTRTTANQPPRKSLCRSRRACFSCTSMATTASSCVPSRPHHLPQLFSLSSLLCCFRPHRPPL